MKASLAVALSLLAAVAWAQEAGPPPANRPAPSPEQMQQIMNSTFSSMVPYMGRMSEAVLTTQLTVMAKPEGAAQMAQYIHNLYQALLKEGFTKQQALEIAARVPMPNVSVGSK